MCMKFLTKKNSCEELDIKKTVQTICNSTTGKTFKNYADEDTEAT